MADPRFFPGPASIELDRIVRITGAVLDGPVPDDVAGRSFDDVAPLDRATAREVTFLDNRKYRDRLSASAAGACLLRPGDVAAVPPGMLALTVGDPYRAFAKLAQAFHPAVSVPAGIHPAAIVDPSAIIAAGVAIAAGAVIGARAELGARCRIGANAVIGDGVCIGADSDVGANASISHALVGARVQIYPGARIGQDGFGFAMSAEGHLRIPQLGRVIIEDDVEVGANVCIDRGSGPDTVIGRGTMIDNLVQIGHNVTIGAGCVIVAQSGISGSTTLEAHAVMAAQSGIAGHLTIGRGARIAAQSGVMRDVPVGAEVMGTPAVPLRQFFRQAALLGRMAAKRDE